MKQLSRHELLITEAESGYVVGHCRSGFPDDEIVLCPTVKDVNREVVRILDGCWKLEKVPS